MSEQTDLLQQIDLVQQSVDDLRKRYLKEFCKLRNITDAPTTVLPLVAELCGVDPQQVLAGGRSARWTPARHLTMWALRELTVMSFPQIAEALNRRDHTTAMYAHTKIQAERKRDEGYRRKTDALLKLCSDALAKRDAASDSVAAA